MDTDHHKLSTHLCAVLDSVGASEDIRQLCWETCMAFEIQDTVRDLIIIGSNGRSFYYFGSSCEGTKTVGLQSDTDMLICAESKHVIDNIIDATELCYLMVKDCNTKPGYVQLQKVVDGIPLCFLHRPGQEEYDDYGRTCLIHLREINGTRAKENLITTMINGPSVTCSWNMNDLDTVIALRCRKVPNFANSWIHRTRQYDWPSQKQIQRMKSFGCFLVGVAHPCSHKKSIEWRISFSLQERELMQGLNQTQHKCYILLKIIKNDLIEPTTGKSISSYHCKTCLFYTIETSMCSLWIPKNLILCTCICLVRLLHWSKNGNCPNYFIPEENMFDRLDKPTLESVNSTLMGILESGIEFFFRLECDNIGALLRKNLSGIPQNKTDIDIMIQSKLIRSVLFANYYMRNKCLQKIPAESNKSLRILEGRLTYLYKSNKVTEHSTGDVRMALNYIIPHIHLQVAQCLASVDMRRRGTSTNDPLPLDILLNIIESSLCSRTSARLSLAACYLQYGMLEACEQLLLSVEISLKHILGSICGCYFASFYTDTYLDIQPIIDCNNVTTKEFVEQYTTGCLVFLQSQANIVHPALQYELYRSVYTPASSRDWIDFWFDWVVVDPKVFLYFLQYIFCTKTNKPEHRRKIVEKFRYIIKEDNFIFHRETAYNLLGWMLIQEHRVKEAWQCMCQSLRIKPFHNAAKWHIVLLLSEL